MLSPRWRKVLRDLTSYRSRTVLVVLSIAVGVFAVGMVSGSYILLSRTISERYAAAAPASATLFTEPFDLDLVQSVARLPEIAVVEGRRTMIVRLQVAPQQWRTLQLTAIPDFEQITVNRITPQQGAWPPPEQTVLIERASLGLTAAAVGESIQIETARGKRRDIQIAGLAHDFTRLPTFFTGTIYGYISFDTLEWLGEPRDFDELHLIVASHPTDRAHIRQVADTVRAQIEKGGRTVSWTSVPTPGEHPMQFAIQAMLLLLSTLGVLSLVLSGFLALTTIQALLAQQVRQIGVMKTIGARRGQIMRLYLGLVLLFGALALLIAIPLAAISAQLTIRYVARLLNFDVAATHLPLSVLLLEVLAGLIVPLLATFWPIISGTRITIREAITAQGVAVSRQGPGLIDRLLNGVRGLSRPLMLSLRNTFRRRGRLALTLTTLSLAGAIFIAVFSVRASTLQTTLDAQRFSNYDISIAFRQPYPSVRLEQEALRVPNVIEAEAWSTISVRRQRLDATESRSLELIAPPPGTRLLQPTVLAGRWLLPEDENGLVINTDVLREEPDVRVGMTLTLLIDGRETRWQVVGLVRGILAGPQLYANRPYLAQVARTVGQTSDLKVVTAQRDPEAQTAIGQALEAHLKGVGLRVTALEPMAASFGRTAAQFNIIIVFLLIMALILALVGGLGLMGTMSMNVLERRREVGVMRAIGASDRAVLHIFMVEGVLIGAMSWVLGVVMALPLSKLLSDAVGREFTRAPLSYTFSAGGALLWLALSILLAAAATFLPARQASRLSIREVLAYE